MAPPVPAAGATTPAATPPAVTPPGLPPPPATTPPLSEGCGGCLAGQACRDGRCLADCRDTRAIPCAAPMLCDYLSGQCLPNGRLCSLSGRAEPCGAGEAAVACGPGSRCNGNGGCLADAGCRRVICDEAGFCRGSDCPEQGGGVRNVVLERLEDARAGTRMSLQARARIDAERPCGLTVTYQLRRDSELFVSARNDGGVWRVPLSGSRSQYLRETGFVSGLAADRTGTLHYALAEEGQIWRVPATGGASARHLVATVAPRINAITFGPDGLLYVARSNQVLRLTPGGEIEQTFTVPAGQSISGLVFDRAGGLLAAELWSRLWRLPPGGTVFTVYADAAGVVPRDTVEPYHQGMALGPDGLVYVGVFPTTNTAGLVYRLDARAQPTRFLGLSEIKRGVPQTRYAGIHGLSFGVDGTLYFVNQNTETNTLEPLGQVLAFVPGKGISLLQAGLNVDWEYGYDGKIVVAQQTVATATAPLDTTGYAVATLDAPNRAGVYGLRVLVTDPATGAIAETQGTVRVLER